jgi:hypothetical protein
MLPFTQRGLKFAAGHGWRFVAGLASIVHSTGEDARAPRRKPTDFRRDNFGGNTGGWSRLLDLWSGGLRIGHLGDVHASYILYIEVAGRFTRMGMAVCQGIFDEPPQ